MKWSRLYWGHRFLQTMHALYISSLWFRLVAGCCRIAVYFSNAEIENFPFLCRNATDYWKLQQICSIVWTSINQNTRVPFDQNNLATSNHGAPCSNTWTAYHTNTHSPFCQNSSLATSPCLAIWSTFQMAWILPKMIVPRDEGSNPMYNLYKKGTLGSHKTPIINGHDLFKNFQYKDLTLIINLL